MIESVNLDALTFIRTSIDDMATRVTTFENRQRQRFKISASKAEVEKIKKDVNYFKSRKLTTFIQATEDSDTPKTLQIPQNTKGDTCWEEVIVDESDVETGEDNIDVHDAII